jgi:hypothetical protein
MNRDALMNERDVQNEILDLNTTSTKKGGESWQLNILTLPEAFEMEQLTNATLRTCRFGFSSLLLIGSLTIGSGLGFSQDKKKPEPETIRATAMGTGSQMGQYVNVTLTIYDYSTPEDKQTLLKAFQQGQTQGLANALNKMKAVGRCEMEGTMGYDVSFIRAIQTPTGRQIRFLTNRPLKNMEVITDSQSQAYDLTAGEINLNTADKKKSTGFIYPAAQLVIDKQGEFQFVLNQNAWNLISILDFKGTPGVN